MEVYIGIKYDGIKADLSRDSDILFRGIQERFPNSTWERSGLGYKVITED